MRKIVGEKKKTQRNRFTRMCMGDALVNIMQQKAYDKISVSDIVKKAGVSRMTYYNYYETKDELVKDYIEEITSLYLEEEKNNLKEKNNIIKEMLKKNMAIDLIAEVTHSSKNNILKIAKS